MYSQWESPTARQLCNKARAASALAPHPIDKHEPPKSLLGTRPRYLPASLCSLPLCSLPLCSLSLCSLSLTKRTSSMSPISSRMLCQTWHDAHCTNTVPRSQASGFTLRVVRPPVQAQARVTIAPGGAGAAADWCAAQGAPHLLQVKVAWRERRGMPSWTLAVPLGVSRPELSLLTPSSARLSPVQLCKTPANVPQSALTGPGAHQGQLMILLMAHFGHAQAQRRCSKRYTAAKQASAMHP